jgi:hypothetical protein
MLPLFLHELWEKTIEIHRKAPYRFVTLLLSVGCVSLGSLASLALAILYRYGRSFQEINDLRQGIGLNILSLATPAVWISGLGTIIVSLKASPWLIPLAFLGSIFQRRWRLLAFTFLTIVFIIATRPYFYRVVYAIPILILATTVTGASILTGYSQRRTNALRVVLASAFVVVIMALGLGLLGARTYLAEKEKSTRDPRILYNVAESTIGRGPVQIYVGPWEFYYAGRLLDWKMYWSQPYGLRFDWARMTPLLDCAILDRSQLSDDIDSQLTTHGFSKVTVRPAHALPPGLSTGKNYDRDYVVYFKPDFKLTRSTSFQTP